MSKLSVASAGIAGMLLSAAPALAQYDDMYDYGYDYEVTDEAAGAAAAGLAGMGFLWIAIWCCAIIFGLINLVFWIISLIHCIQHAPEDQKTLWIILILLVPFGSWVYFFTKRKQWSGTPAPKAVEAKPVEEKKE